MVKYYFNQNETENLLALPPSLSETFQRIQRNQCEKGRKRNKFILPLSDS